MKRNRRPVPTNETGLPLSNVFRYALAPLLFNKKKVDTAASKVYIPIILIG